MIWLGLVAIIVVIVKMIINLKNNYCYYDKDEEILVMSLYGVICFLICIFTYLLCIVIPPIPTESSISTKSIEITEFRVIKDNTLKDDCFFDTFDTNEYSYTTADNIVYNNVRVDILGEIKNDSITSIEVQNNTPKKLIITENKNFDLRSFFIITTYEYTFV
ncbi:hypothetical protein E2N93_06745 [Ruminococcus bromii]|uniref:Uncharacterized protein n=1 Tax=Ruminococcus bromii TaxID=40518 RepID=A0ABT0NJD5_9FIRM|nr:hypothetical protein [Ruminococcus bromii]MCL3787704.1 hypothetical protein [Ruminococcus bromii]